MDEEWLAEVLLSHVASIPLPFPLPIITVRPVAAHGCNGIFHTVSLTRVLENPSLGGWQLGWSLVGSVV
jgi:hypothetical protein